MYHARTAIAIWFLSIVGPHKAVGGFRLGRNQSTQRCSYRRDPLILKANGRSATERPRRPLAPLALAQDARGVVHAGRESAPGELAPRTFNGTDGSCSPEALIAMACLNRTVRICRPSGHGQIDVPSIAEQSEE